MPLKYIYMPHNMPFKILLKNQSLAQYQQVQQVHSHWKKKKKKRGHIQLQIKEVLATFKQI